MVEGDSITICIYTVADDIKITILVKFDNVNIIMINALVILRDSKARNKADLIACTNEVGNLRLTDGEGKGVDILIAIQITDVYGNTLVRTLDVATNGIIVTLALMVIIHHSVHERAVRSDMIEIFDNDGLAVILNLYRIERQSRTRGRNSFTDHIHQIASRFTKLRLYTFVSLQG